MTTARKLAASLVTAVTVFSLAVGHYSAAKEAPNALKPELYLVLPDLPSPPPTSTTTTLPPANTAAGVAARALAAGLPPDQIAKAVKVAFRESRYQPLAHNKNDTVGQSRGHYQINSFWCEPSTYWPKGWLQTKGVLSTCNDLFIPAINAAAMVAIWRNSGWRPWATRNGK